MQFCFETLAVTKYEKMLKKRMENIDNYVVPPNEFHLPSIPEGAIAAFSFSLADGVKLRVSCIFQIQFSSLSRVP